MGETQKMRLIKLSEKNPEPYAYFTALNQETGEYFNNYLVKSEFNYFYMAGKKFTHWLDNNKRMG